LSPFSLQAVALTAQRAIACCGWPCRRVSTGLCHFTVGAWRGSGRLPECCSMAAGTLSSMAYPRSCRLPTQATKSLLSE